MSDTTQDDNSKKTWGRWTAIDDKSQFGGGMARVWRVRRSDGDADGTIRALKELRHGQKASRGHRERFAREIAVVGELARDGVPVVEVLDSDDGSDGHLPYLVMPLAESSLKRAIRSYKGSIDQVVRLGLSLAATLGQAHVRGIIHRDVKPDNVLLFGDERLPRVCDFGICFLLEEEDRLTRAEGGTLGTDDFVAPELKGGGEREPTAAADVYSLGKTLYTVVTGGSLLPREYLDREDFDLVRLFPDDPRMLHLREALRSMIQEQVTDRIKDMAGVSALLERVQRNLQVGRPYEPGMYASDGLSAAEISGAVESAARNGDAIERQDALRDLLLRTVLRATALADDAVRAGGDEAGALARSRADEQAQAVVVGETLLAYLVPLVRREMLADIEQASSTLEQFLVGRDATGQQYRAADVLAAGSAFTLHVLTGLSWERRRWSILRSLLEFQRRTATRLLHLGLFDRGAGLVLPWVMEQAKKSVTLDHLAPAYVAVLNDAVAIGAGLVLMSSLFGMTDEELRQHGQPDIGLRGPAFPGYYRVGRSWGVRLPQYFRAERLVETAVAEQVFGISVSEFRRRACDITPALARAVNLVAQVDERDWIEWGFDAGEGWHEWCHEGRA